MGQGDCTQIGTALHVHTPHTSHHTHHIHTAHTSHPHTHKWKDAHIIKCTGGKILKCNEKYLHRKNTIATTQETPKENNLALCEAASEGAPSTVASWSSCSHESSH